MLVTNKKPYEKYLLRKIIGELEDYFTITLEEKPKGYLLTATLRREKPVNPNAWKEFSSSILITNKDSDDHEKMQEWTKKLVRKLMLSVLQKREAYE